MKSNDDLQKLGLFFFQINNKNFDHFTFNFLKGEDTLIYSSDEQLWNKFKQILTKSVNYNGIIFNDGEILDNLKNKINFTSISFLKMTLKSIKITLFLIF